MKQRGKFLYKLSKKLCEPNAINRIQNRLPAIVHQDELKVIDKFSRKIALKTCGRTVQKVKARFYYERGKDYSFFVLLILFALLALDSILSAEKSIKERKNALFHARRGNRL